MTTNEQIIIDGVDVSKCKAYFPKLGKQDDCIALGIGTKGHCADNPSCIYKQLQRKTAECEGYFKQRNNILEECVRYQEEIGKLQKSQFCVAYEKDCHKVCKQQNCAIKNSYRYKQALDEIEKKIKEINGSDILIVPDLSLQENAKAIMRQCNKGYREILDIISEAKGANVENT